MTIEEINKLCPGTLMELLNIQFTHYDGELMKAEMPVGPAVHQPGGNLHGGATLALAESVGSALSYATVVANNEMPVGVEINANHIRPLRDGKLMATARFLHKGSSIHVIDIVLTDGSGKLVAVCRLTNKILKR